MRARKRGIGRLAAAGTLAAGVLTSAEAAEPWPPGASSCSGCHATARERAAIPPVAGRPAAEIAESMRAFRTGERPATVMDRIAKGFSEEETRAIAVWLSERP